MSRLARAGLALGVLLAGATGVVSSVPVEAQAAAPACPAPSDGDATRISGSLSGPTADQVENDAFNVVATGSGFRYNDRPERLDFGDVSSIAVQVIGCDGQALPGNSGTTFPYSADDGGGRTFEWPTPKLAWNGRYVIRAVVNAKDTSRTIVRQFHMDRPATPPSDVVVSEPDNGAVTVTWKAPPVDTDPDVLGYIVEWAPAGGDFSNGSSADILPVEEDEAAPTTFTHSPGAGEWQYRVLSLRPGGGGEPVNTSKPATTSRTVTIAAAPTTTAGGGTTATTERSGSTSSGTGVASGGTTATTARSGNTARSAGSVDLSNFSRLLDQRRTATPAPRRPAEPDPGFQETLPFQPGDQPAVAASTENAGAPPPQELAQEVVSDDSDRRRAMTFVAASLLFAVLAYGLRLVKREADRYELEPTEPSAAPSGEPAPPAAMAAPVDAMPDVTSETPPPLDETSFADDRELVAVGAPVAARMPAPRPVASSTAPHLDVALPARRPRRPRPDGVGTGDAGRATRRVPSGPRADRGTSGEAVRPRRRGAGSSDRRASVG